MCIYICVYICIYTYVFIYIPTPSWVGFDSGCI